MKFQAASGINPELIVPVLDDGPVHTGGSESGLEGPFNEACIVHESISLL
jgi:hypothetical protein